MKAEEIMARNIRCVSPDATVVEIAEQMLKLDVMTEGIIYGFSDQDVGEISQIMEEHQIRRLPVLDRNKRLVGLIATADVALNAECDLTVRS